MSDGIDRPYNRLSGWCSQHGRPNCQGCKNVTCALPERRVRGEAAAVRNG